MNRRSITWLSVLWICAPFAAQAAPITPSPYAFSYQGELRTNDGTPATGPCTFRFSLFDAVSAGSSLSGTPLPPQFSTQQPSENVPTITTGVVPVDNGVFTIESLDFKLDPHDRYLDVQVSCGNDPGFTTLAPRHRIAINGEPPGTVTAFGGRIADIPYGWILCDGRSLPRTGLYSRLFAAIGLSHGSNDANSFRLPDFRGYFLRGVNSDANPAIDPDVATRTAVPGASHSGGNSVGSIQDDAVGPHRHSIPGANAGDGGGAAFQSNSTSNVGPWTLTAPPGAAESRPKNKYVNYIIKY